MSQHIQIIHPGAHAMALSLCRGCFQRALVLGSHSLSGSTRYGAARRHGQYFHTTNTVLARLENAGCGREVRQGGHRRVLVLEWGLNTPDAEKRRWEAAGVLSGGLARRVELLIGVLENRSRQICDDVAPAPPPETREQGDAEWDEAAFVMSKSLQVMNAADLVRNGKFARAAAKCREAGYEDLAVWADGLQTELRNFSQAVPR